MEQKINLDRAVNLEITYPIGTKEILTFTYNALVELTDIYEVLISKSKK